MSESDIENWMHATDEERINTLAGWDVENDEDGQDKWGIDAAGEYGFLGF